MDLVGADYSRNFGMVYGLFVAAICYEEVNATKQSAFRTTPHTGLSFLWRDFFGFTALKYDTALFLQTGI